MFPALRWKSVNVYHKEITQPLNFDPYTRPRRQDWMGEMIENGMFYFSMRDILVNENAFQGPRLEKMTGLVHVNIIVMRWK